MLMPKIWIICRVCLKQHQDMFNIFDNMFNKSIWTLLRDCGGVPVRKNDDLPDKICAECLRKLWKAENFRIDCQRGHRELVQMLLERNVLMYKIDLEDENERSDFSTIFTENNEYRPSNSLVSLQQHIFTNEEQTHENITPTPNGNANIEHESSSHNIEQYYVVSKQDEKEQHPEKINIPDEKKPIVLVLKLKNMPHEKTHTETKRIEAATKTTPKIKIDKQAVRKGSSETAVRKGSSETVARINVNSKLKSKTNKMKLNYIAKIKLKSKLNRTKANFTCKICKKIFKTYELLRHHRYIHKRPHQCKICHKRFSQRMLFLSHNNKHTGIKPYYCRICYTTFTDISNRNRHERVCHIMDEFKCEQCPKKFRFLHLLQKHGQSHRPKICFICNKEFSSLQIVRTHHHRIHLNKSN